jgi:hypothetical protein
MSKLGTLVSDFKKIGSDIKSALEKVAGSAPGVIATVMADEAKIAPVIESFLPGSAVAITWGNNLMDAVAQAIEDAGAAAGSSGLSVSLDQQLVTDGKAVIAAARTASGIKV